MVPASRKIRTDVFEKVWNIPPNMRTPVLRRRIKRIETCSAMPMTCIPPIVHTWENNILRQKMPLLPQLDTTTASQIDMRSHLIDLATDIEQLHRMNLIHGDIHPKNVIYTGKKLCLVDFEPIPEYSNGAVRYYCSTRPWMAHDDLKNKKLSILTDRIGFMHTAMKLLRIQIPAFNTLATYRARLRSDHPIGGLISDEVVKNRNCRELVHYIDP